MSFRRVAAVVRCALVAIGLWSALPAVAAAQDVLCDPGERVVRKVSFDGNATFGNDLLSARVLSTPSSTTRRIFRYFGAQRCYPFGDGIGLANDASNLRLFYQNNGFYDTRVDTVLTLLPNNRADIRFQVTEGQPLVLDSLAINGLDSVPERVRLLRDSVLKVGERIGPLLVAAQMDTITNRLRNTGYPKATAFQAFDIHRTEHRAELALNVEPGVRARIGSIRVNGVGVNGGAGQIDSSVVLSLLGFRHGDLYNETALADARRRLYDLAVYRHVDVAVDSTWTHGDSLADVIVDVREDFFKQVDTDFGWGQLDCFKVSSVYTDKNFQRQARRLDLTGRLSKIGWADPAASTETRSLCDHYRLENDSLASSKLNYYLGGTIRYPTLFGRAFTPAFSLYTERQGQYQAFLRNTEVGFDASATRDIARQTPLRIGYTFERGSTTAEPVVLCAIFSRCTEEDRAAVQGRLPLGIASISLQRTRTDNLVAPTRGYSASIEARYSAPFLASDDQLRFSKTTADLALYRTVKRGVTFAARARGGLIVGGTNTNGSKLPPPQERLYAGGPTTVRGFQQNQLGPQVYLMDDNGVAICRQSTTSACTRTSLDTISVARAESEGVPFFIQATPNGRQARSIPSGGNLLAVLNAELRIRDPFFTNLIEYVPFIDAGQVWITDIRQNVHRGSLAVTPGLGVRYYSPVGPVQINLGYNKYDATPGLAYYTIPATGAARQNRPLLCVTPQGSEPLVITPANGSLEQTCGSATYQPPGTRGFFRHINLTLSIGTDF